MEREAAQRLVVEAARELRHGSREDGARGSAVLTLVNAILDMALAEEATDVHLEPMDGGLRIRIRVDGLLAERPVRFPPELAPVIVARLKVMAGIDTAKRNRPQDGQIRYRYGERLIDMRVAVLPVLGGERMVVRIMDASERFLSCAELGFTPHNQEIFERLIRRPTGLLLLCGPMNSGKTTTLYAALSALNEPSCHIMTLEDPVERRLDGISQFQVNVEAGLTFVAGLRAALRQDAQKILLGEIRDRETAEMAVRIALTGHALFSTLHTEDTVSAVFRMIEMGVPPYLLAATLSGVIAQRLVRRVCPHCSEEYAISRDSREAMQLGELYHEGMQLTRGQGCVHCHGSGYRGRMAIHEVLPVTERLRAAILAAHDKETLRRAAEGDGMATLWQDGAAKACVGKTTLAEVGRALYG
ncbi:pilus assembly protein [Selenomonas sp. oral taxon 126]|uniref:GspE/PulE family protein n=1 Tax=Selenomonas sp. oral taxon 126 TaxID=712528 RepID=UPI0008078F93|nr:GspE/PulE family protein [Selenomonas sp. oral taxon 126]ANR69595.1 pilus assembly protein [Selenomonas sp. oral taxon 126]